MLGYTTIDIPFGRPNDAYPLTPTAPRDSARPSNVEYDPNDIDEYVIMLPTKNVAYPVLTLDPTAQYTFFDNAPFFRMTEESSPVLKVVVVWNIHIDVEILRPSRVK